MLLYHFLNLEYGLEDIQKQRLKISRFNDLNDPFEFLGIDLREPEFRKAIRNAKSEIDKDAGLLCFSASWRSPLQWAHYADRHKGICLGFEINDAFKHEVHEVSYQRGKFKSNGILNAETVIKLLTTKFSGWKYEEEHRIFVPLNEPENGLYFLPFEGNLSLKEVYIGSNCNVCKETLREALGSQLENVKVSKVRAGFSKFEMVNDRKYEFF